jgi:tetratricopeptide (TPR) repeat protein
MKLKALIIILLSAISYQLSATAFAQTLEEAEAQYLQANYTQATDTLEKILSLHVDQKSPARLYYLLGLSYLKGANVLRASDCFDIIIKEYPDSEFVQQAQIKSMDINILRGDFKRALEASEAFLRNYPQSQFRSAALLRKYTAQSKLGDWQAAKITLSDLQTRYPYSPEVKAREESSERKEYFCVQVGSFKDKLNAQNLVNLLSQKGYDSYIADNQDGGFDNFYRVRVGRLGKREEANSLAKKLSDEGFPTKIVP